MPEYAESFAPGVAMKSFLELVYYLVEEVNGSGRSVTMAIGQALYECAAAGGA